ncbi:DNA repair protein (Mre11) [Paramicrosporidium saccamoebae]|uniref:Double-strand break repair protein n=1 Tax=Paramicrosporidium saccamoebae TaxID=1246581 RepID=A0A2H9TQ96_9FUNG|nr:DNA repair protein (Mre11) [Paramicrosporidium saccamoebae]
MSSTLSILIATDNHLGYNEKDVLRGDDSFKTFEEILQIARSHSVDCMLLGGDLFHENRPSRLTLHRTLELLRHYCLGSRPCSLELLSDPAVNFPSKFGTVNYEDPNYNVALPVFAIHGNHDDPTGEGGLSSLDLLSTAGLLNYFGKTNSVDDISMVPVLLRKGATKLALYGLGAVRDERLHRTFLQRKVKLLRPPDADDWYNMLLLHQNRVAHGPTNYIPESFIDDFVDLVIWGHEHECQACEPDTCPRGFTVCQPGSSVATSLSEGETRKKHVVILEITGRTMKMIPVPLKSVRPFLMRDVSLKQVPDLQIHDVKAISRHLTQQIEEMILIARSEWDADNSSDSGEFPLPLIRLRVDYSANLDSDGFASSFSIMNPQRFGQQFVGRIANPRDAVSFMRRRQLAVIKKKPSETATTTRSEATRVEDLVTHFLGCQKLDLFPQNEFSDTVRIAVEKDDREAISSFVKQAMERALGTVAGSLERELLREEFEKSRKLREDEWGRMHSGIEEFRPSVQSALDTSSRTVPAPSTRSKAVKRPTSLISAKGSAKQVRLDLTAVDENTRPSSPEMSTNHRNLRRAQ